MKKTEDDYFRVAQKMGFLWVGESLPKKTIINTYWECSNGHLIFGCYSNINRGMGCKQCQLESRKKTKKDYIALSNSRDDLEWHSEQIPNKTHNKTEWICKHGHIWLMSYHNVQQGQGCPFCAGNKPKTESDYYKVVEHRSIEWIGKDIPKTSKHHTWWKCTVCDYEWQTIYNTIQQGKGCPRCAIERNAQKKRHTASDYHNLAERMNVEWIGKLPKNSRTKTLWKCKKCNSEWMTEYSEIRSGYGCHSCANMVNGKKVSASQLKLADRIGGIVNHKVGNMWVDVVFPDRKIAIEYDSWYWHSDSQESDNQRAIDLINLGWKVLAIKANLKVPSKKKITQSITNLSPDTPYTEIVMSDWGKGSTAKQILGFN